MQYLKPDLKKIILFLIFTFILFSPLFLPALIGDWYALAYFARLFVFLPLTFILHLLIPILGNDGDYFYTPVYLQVLFYIAGILYSYILASLLLDSSTNSKWNQIFRIALAVFIFAVGSLFLIWQFNPNYNHGSSNLEEMKVLHGWLISAVIFYLASFLLIYKVRKVNQAQKISITE